MARDDEIITVEIVYALPQQQTVKKLSVCAGSTVREAVEQSGLLDTCPEIGAVYCAFGIFGKRVSGDIVLDDGDRVEIYRPLTADPKEARRRRARKPK